MPLNTYKEKTMADRWVIAYDIDSNLANEAQQHGGVTIMTVYNRIRACLASHGFTEFTQLSVYAMPDEDNALVRVYQALQALSQLDENQFIKRLHLFKIDGALNDVLPLVAGHASAPSTAAAATNPLVANLPLQPPPSYATTTIGTTIGEEM
jgi:virulence-associated protein VapD